MQRRHRARAAAVACLTLVASCGGGSPTPASQYLKIAKIGNVRLDHDFDGLDDAKDLATARADLVDAAATERRFDRSLLAITFTAAIEATARAMVRVNELRATLASEAATSKSFAQLHASETRLSAANAPVEVLVKKIRRQLGLPPPESS